MIDSGRHATQMPTTQEPIEQNRVTFIQTLHLEYKRQLNHMLQRVAMAAVGLHKDTDIIRSSLPLVLHGSSGTVEESHPSYTSIIQAYGDAGQRLLILGEAGAGKTTLLLELADELLMRAEGDTTLPIPVILNLCSWASQKSPLENWLIDQLQVTYHVPSRVSQTWLEQNSWLLLLDGLDEVEEASRPACIEAINTYRAEDRSMPLVVCSRSQEYLAQEPRLAISNTVVVQPLQKEQVTEYLDQLGEAVTGIREAVRTNPTLCQLITTPLMLQVVILAYRGETNIDLPRSSSPEELQLLVFDHYVERTLGQRSAGEQFSPQQTRHWLGWLAQQMKDRHFTEFYLGWLQPSWLLSDRSQIQYRLLYMLICGLANGLVYGLIGGLTYGLVGRLTYGLVVGLILGLVVGVAGGLLDNIKQIRPVEVLTWSWKNAWQEPFADSHDGKAGVLTWSRNSIWQGLIVGLLIWLISWMIIGLIPAVIAGLIGGVIGWLIVDLLAGLIARVAYELINGISGEQVSRDIHIKPNQAIHDSGSKALCLGLAVGLVVGLIGWLIGGRILGLRQGLVLSVFLGVFLGELVAQGVGGRTYVGHYILRYILYRNGVMPWNYIRFLEEAARHNLLQQVAGGYRFIHPLFIDYFACHRTSATKAPLSVLTTRG